MKKVLISLALVISVTQALNKVGIAESIFECEVDKTLHIYSMYLTISDSADAIINIKKEGENFGICNYRVLFGKYKRRIHVPRLFVKMELGSCNFYQSAGDLEKELGIHAFIRMELSIF